MRFLLLVVAFFGTDICSAGGADDDNDNNKVIYGADVSTPVHHLKVSTNYAYLPHNVDPDNHPTPDEYIGMPIQPLGDKQSGYEQMMENWRQSYIEDGDDPSVCDEDELARIESNREQPTMAINYTDTGYKKMKLPTEIFDQIVDFWNNNRDQEEEEYLVGIVNQWDIPTTMIQLEDESLEGGGDEIRQAIWDTLREIVADWTGQDLVGSSLYGIRVYKEGNVLLPHVDRFPLICSAIINVAQDVDEDWPLEVYGRDGNAVNITMEPGDLVLYESHSLIHGRPFPLKGRYFANIFVHFEPKYDHTQRASDIPPYIRQDVAPELFQKHYLDELIEGGGENDEGYYDEELYDEWGESKDLWEEGFWAAYRGHIETLQDVLEEDPERVHHEDNEGWTMLDYAISSGHTDAAKLLIEKGATDIAPDLLEIATVKWGESHGVVELLQTELTKEEL